MRLQYTTERRSEMRNAFTACTTACWWFARPFLAGVGIAFVGIVLGIVVHQILLFVFGPPPEWLMNLILQPWFGGDR